MGCASHVLVLQLGALIYVPATSLARNAETLSRPFYASESKTGVLSNAAHFQIAAGGATLPVNCAQFSGCVAPNLLL
jgi:hypothetical protein